MTSFLIWLRSMPQSLGNGSFTVQSPKVISELTQADGHLTTAGCLTQQGKELIQGCLHSKMMASQVLLMQSDDARQVIEHQSDKYFWTDLARLDEEMDGMTILALIFCCLHPHHKVDMYAEIRTIEKNTIIQYDNDVHFYFNAIKSKKLAIDMKDSTAYTDDFFVRDISQQLKHESLPPDF
jgi:hypothetical protein